MNTVVTNDQDQELLTTAEVAAMTRAPVSSVRYWRYLGTGPASFRVGRRVLYRRAAVLRWLADRESGSCTSHPVDDLRRP